MDIKQIQKELKKKIKKNVTFEDQTENNSKVGNNLKNTSDVKIQTIINTKKKLQNRFKDKFFKPNEKETVFIKKDDEDEDEDNIKKEKKQHKSTDVNKIINVQKNLKDRFRNTIVKQKHVIEEQQKKYGPIINALTNVNTTMNAVKDVAIKTEGDIQKLNKPYYYEPRNPELKRLTSSEETFGTPKFSSQKSTNNSPLPTNIIKLDSIAAKYVPTIKDTNSFGIYYNEKDKIHMIGKDKISFDKNDIILNGNRYNGTPGLWRLLTHQIMTSPNYYTPDDFNIYKNILIETNSIYQNNDPSTKRAKSSGGDKYNNMIKNIWREMNGNNEETPDKKKNNKKISKKKENNEDNEIIEKIENNEILAENNEILTEDNQIGKGLKKYTENRIEYRYISNVNQVIDNLQFISAEERAGNNNFKNEKLGILHLFKIIMENHIDTPEGIEYLLKYVTCLPKEVKISKEKITKRIHYISIEESIGNNIYHDEKLDILNICIREMEKLIDIPIIGADYLSSYVSCLPKKIITGSGIVNFLLNCSSLPQIHWPGYNYLGPGTKLEKNKKPINKLDEAAREHDYFYKDNKDTKTRHIADKILEQKAMERFYDPHSSIGEKTAAFVTENVMDAKIRFGMNLI